MNLLSPVDTSSYGLYICLFLVSKALLGFGWRCGFSYHIFPDVSITVGYIPSLSLFIFISCVSNTLDFRRNIEESTPFLRAPLYIFDVWRFPEEALKLPETFLTLSAQADLSVPSDLLGVSDIVARLPIVRPLLWRNLCGILLVP